MKRFTQINEDRTIKNKKLYTLLEKCGFTELEISSDVGTVYLYDNGCSLHIRDNGFYACGFGSQPVENWVLDIIAKIFDDCDIEDIQKAENVEPNWDEIFKVLKKCKFKTLKDVEWWKNRILKFQNEYSH